MDDPPQSNREKFYNMTVEEWNELIAKLLPRTRSMCRHTPGLEPEEAIEIALYRVAIGKRHLREDMQLVETLFGIIESVVSHERERGTTKVKNGSDEEQEEKSKPVRRKREEFMEESDLEQLTSARSNQSDSPEQIAERKELIELIHSWFPDDPEVCELAELFLEKESIMKRREIAQSLEIGVTDVTNATKRMRTKIPTLLGIDPIKMTNAIKRMRNRIPTLLEEIAKNE